MPPALDFLLRNTLGTQDLLSFHVYIKIDFSISEQNITIHNSWALETTQVSTSDEWIKKMWYTYTMEFYSTIRNDIWFEGKWMQLEDIMLSEVSKTQKDKVSMFSLICGR
jgi:hypothetical protein